MRPAEVARRAADYLERHGVQSPVPTAEALLANVLSVSRVGLYTGEDPLSPAEARRFGRALCLRCTGTPLQHLTGEQGFRHLLLAVRPGVFVPRPETEVLVQHCLDAIAGNPRPVVVDVGTGTGAIALAIADEHPGALVIATDLAPEAVQLASENAERLGLAISVLQGDLLDPVAEELRGTVDLVVSNPPYVESAEMANLPQEVRADPPLALAGGIEIYRRLFDAARGWIRPGGSVAVEIGQRRGAAVSQAATSAGFDRMRVHADLVGRDRVVVGRRS
ncbi:MAG: peptide chain release factor N(5)-glutamine methyltransferase [Actinomycetota bacterium]